MLSELILKLKKTSHHQIPPQCIKSIFQKEACSNLLSYCTLTKSHFTATS